MPQPADLYLRLMKSCLLNTIYADYVRPRPQAGVRWKRWVVKALKARNLEVVYGRDRAVLSAERERNARIDGLAWLPDAHTMIGARRLDNLQACIEDVLERDVPGDLIEAGVWRGGASIFMRAVLKAHGVEDRDVWLADSFQGLPPPNDALFPADAGDLHHSVEELSVSLDEVRHNFGLYELLDDRVQFLPGWFRDTLTQAPIERLAVIRIDADMYESTTQVLEALPQARPRRLRDRGRLRRDPRLPACRRRLPRGDGHRRRDPDDRLDGHLLAAIERRPVR